MALVPKRPINNKPVLDQIMVRRRNQAAINWTSDGKFHSRTYSSLGFNELQLISVIISVIAQQLRCLRTWVTSLLH